MCIDAVDNGQNKKAVQLADKILKKKKDLQCARVRRRREESVWKPGSVSNLIFSPAGFESDRFAAHWETR